MGTFSNQPICEADWIERNAVWEGDKLISIRMAVRLAEPDVERCAWCGAPTIFGAYVRAEAASLPYPRSETP